MGSIEEVPVRVEWLARRGGGTARLELDPPQLGRVEMLVRLRGSEVEVVIAASEPLAQAAIHAQRTQLAESLAARDLRLGQLDVGQSGGGDAFGAQAQGSGERGFHGGDGYLGADRRSAARPAGLATDPTSNAAGFLPAHPLARADARIDLHA
jgi:flagellar hook-length control protein FliK